jgi:hypothetical protein
MSISTIRGLCRYIKLHSNFSGRTINSVIIELGFHPLHGTNNEFKELSGILKDCSTQGADCGFSGFTYYSDTITFFRKHRTDIVQHMEQAAEEMGTNIISMVQNFGVFRHGDMPSPSEIGRAIWDSSKKWSDLTDLYNVFAWYALEEVSRTWHRYLEENNAA